VSVERLDDLVTGPVDVVKIDVEGAEAACLRGAERILREHRPLVIFEHGTTVPGDPDDSAHCEVWDVLTAADYRVFSVTGDGPMTALEFATASASGQMWNFIGRSD
jgi:hypothetical protein